MPELPEVATWMRRLQQGGPQVPGLVGLRIEAVPWVNPEVLRAPTAEAFRERLQGQRLRAFGRRGKHLLAYLDEGALVFHLGMSGRFAVCPAGQTWPEHTHLALALEGGWVWCFVAPRRFGYVAWHARPWEALQHLGPDALGPLLDAEGFARRVRRRQARIKTLLLDQRFLAGVGNIYADEALHRAGIHPARRAASLSEAEARRLWHGLQQVLHEGLAHRGATFDAVYPHGGFQHRFRVYGRASAACYTCGTPIARMRLAGRTTHYCPTCQR